MRWAECLAAVHCTAALAQSTGIRDGILLARKVPRNVPTLL